MNLNRKNNRIYLLALFCVAIGIIGLGYANHPAYQNAYGSIILLDDFEAQEDLESNMIKGSNNSMVSGVDNLTGVQPIQPDNATW